MEDSKISQAPSLKRQKCSSSSTLSPDSTSNLDSKISQRNLEERRQHAIVACRNRRGAESGLIQDLGRALPVTAKVLKSCDKVAILRLATSYLRLRAMLERLQVQPEVSNVGIGADTAAGVEALLFCGGFVMIMTTDGEIVYVSENGAQGLHCEAHAILGTRIYDHVDQDDHPELDRLLAVEDLSRITPTGTGFKTQQESATVHLRRKLTSKGRGGHEQNSLLRLTGKVFVNLSQPKTKTGNFFIGVVEPLAISPTTPFNPLNYEFPFPNFQVMGVLDFVCSADMRLVRSELKYRVGPPLEFNHDLLVGLSGFEFVHAEDMGNLRETLKSLYKHGSSQTRQGYRMLSALGGWVWVLTHAAMMEVENLDGDPVNGSCGEIGSGTSKRRGTSRAKFCFGRNFLISDIIEQGQPLAAFQMGVEGVQLEEPETAPDMNSDVSVFGADFLDAGFPLGDANEHIHADNLNPISEAEVDWLLEELQLLAETEGFATMPSPAAHEDNHLVPPNNSSAESFPLLKSLLKSVPSLRT